jgi:hypothetical protein
VTHLLTHFLMRVSQNLASTLATVISYPAF